MSEAGNVEQATTEQQGAEAGVDMSAVMDRMEQLSGEIGSVREAIAPAEPQGPEPQYGYDPYGGQDPFAGQQQAYQQQPPNPYGYGYGQQQQPQPGYPQQQPYSPQQVAQQFALDPSNVYDEYGNVNPQAAQQYQQLLQQAVVQPAIQQAVAPIMQQLEDERLNRNTDALIQKYPEYATKEAAEGLVSDVAEWAAQSGMDPQWAVKNDAILEQHILVKRAQQQAAQGASAAGERTHELEAGQGAGPGGAAASFSDQVDAMQREMGGGASPAALNFWGVSGV